MGLAVIEGRKRERKREQGRGTLDFSCFEAGGPLCPAPGLASPSADEWQTWPTFAHAAKSGDTEGGWETWNYLDRGVSLHGNSCRMKETVKPRLRPHLFGQQSPRLCRKQWSRRDGVGGCPGGCPQAPSHWLSSAPWLSLWLSTPIRPASEALVSLLSPGFGVSVPLFLCPYVSLSPSAIFSLPPSLPPASLSPVLSFVTRGVCPSPSPSHPVPSSSAPLWHLPLPSTCPLPRV